jgi:ESCRT-II complex subunit VPS36
MKGFPRTDPDPRPDFARPLGPIHVVLPKPDAVQPPLWCGDGTRGSSRRRRILGHLVRAAEAPAGVPSSTSNAGPMDFMELLPESAGPVGGAGEPDYEPGEVRTLRQGQVHVYSDDHAVKGPEGVAFVTSSRIIWAHSGSAKAVHLKSLLATESVGGGLFGFGVTSTPKLQLTFRTAADAPVSKLQLAFKGGGRDDFLERTQQALRAKKWEAYKAPTRGAAVAGPRNWAKEVGSGGLATRKEAAVTHTTQAMSGAFSDLEGLMSHAKEMVEIANRVARAAPAEGADGADEFAAMMMSAGIDNPVTRQSAGSSYHQELARQLHSFLVAPLERCHGVMTLADVYCLYHDARGIVEMVSPDDLMRACSTFPTIGVPLRMRKLKSNVMVIESEAASDPAIVDARLGEILGEKVHMSAEELARDSGVSLYIAKEQLEGAEDRGVLARDESMQGTRYYVNRFLL